MQIRHGMKTSAAALLLFGVVVSAQAGTVKSWPEMAQADTSFQDNLDSYPSKSPRRAQAQQDPNAANQDATQNGQNPVDMQRDPSGNFQQGPNGYDPNYGADQMQNQQNQQYQQQNQMQGQDYQQQQQVDPQGMPQQQNGN